MCNDDIFNLSEKIYKTTCEIEYLNDLKNIISEDIDIVIDKNEPKEIEKTKTINFKKAM